MPRRPLIILADDLTGAAEIAAIAHQASRRAVVQVRPPGKTSDAEVIVLNTDTRLFSPTKAARHVHALVTRLKKKPAAGLFKKTDSVLRGPVLAELRACTAALGFSRALLVPCNPSLERVIRNGRYFVAGIPLEETIFARDPHHPRRTSQVLALLGADEETEIVCLNPAAPRPKTGIVVGEASSTADITAWAEQLDRRTLAAGGADFFRAWLQRFPLRKAILSENSFSLRLRPALLLRGTTALVRTPSPLDRRALRFRGNRPPPAATVATKLRRDGFVAVASSQARSPHPRAPLAISRGFARLAQQLRRADAFRHLLIAGGATASVVLKALGWLELEVVRVWSPGVVTLRPVADPDFLVTLKPGSYAWPADLSHQISSLSQNP